MTNTQSSGRRPTSHTLPFYPPNGTNFDIHTSADTTTLVASHTTGYLSNASIATSSITTTANVPSATTPQTPAPSAGTGFTNPTRGIEHPGYDQMSAGNTAIAALSALFALLGLILMIYLRARKPSIQLHDYIELDNRRISMTGQTAPANNAHAELVGVPPSSRDVRALLNQTYHALDRLQTTVSDFSRYVLSSLKNILTKRHRRETEVGEV